MYDNFRELLTEMRVRYTERQPPYALFLGAGASLAPDRAAPNRAVDEILHMADVGAPEDMPRAERIEAFYSFLEDLSDEARYKVMRMYLSLAAPSPGYKHLANLVVEGYFDTLITTNFDTFLEESLHDVGLGSADLLILDATQDYFPSRRREPRVKLVKLHGDPYADERLALGDTSLPPDLAGLLERSLSGDLLLVSYHPRDAVIHRFLARGDGELWYVNSIKPDDDHPLASILDSRPCGVISGIYGEFATFFGAMADQLLYREGQKITIEQHVSTISGSVSMDVEIGQSTIGRDAWVAAPEEIEQRDEGDIKSPGTRFAPLSREPEADETKDEDTVDIESLYRQLRALERESNELQKKAAMYGYGNAPLYIRNQIEAAQEAIDSLRGEIGRLSAEGDEPWPR